MSSNYFLARQFVEEKEDQQEACSARIKPEVEKLGYETDYTMSLDDVFLVRNPHNGYETPMYELNILKPISVRTLLFFSEKKYLHIGRVRFVGLFLDSYEHKPIFEARTKDGLDVYDHLKQNRIDMFLKKFRLSDTERFISQTEES